MTDILIILLYILTAILWIWALIDIYKTEFEKNIFKVIWYIVVIMFPILGSLFYFNRKNKFTSRERRKFQPNFRNR